MSQRTAIVTGAASGIGLAVSQALAAGGIRVVMADLNEVAGQAAAEKIGALFVRADLSRQADCRGLVDAALARFGRVDILVNNAGIQHVAPVDDFPVARWDAILAINLSAAFHTVRAALPAMKRKAWGRIVNIASAHALVASPFKSAYVAAKHGIAGFTKTVALELAEQGITVNAVCPGYVLTPLVEKQIPDTARARGIISEAVIRDVLLAAQPTKKFVTVEEVAALTAFLCSQDAASITGAVLPVEGGWTAH